MQNKPILHRITNPVTAECLLHDRMCNLDHEEVWAIYLNSKLIPLDQQMLSKGTIDHTAIDCRTVLRNALLLNASSFILLHNHPSGDPNPSKEDISFTDKLRKACSLIDINLLDHIIVGDESFFSFAEDTTTKYQ